MSIHYYYYVLLYTPTLRVNVVMLLHYTWPAFGWAIGLVVVVLMKIEFETMQFVLSF